MPAEKRRTEMLEPVVAPRSVRSDLLFLRPDLSRPGTLMLIPARSCEDAGVDALIARAENGLHGAASLYRRLLLLLVLAMLTPVVLAVFMWWLFWNAPVLPFTEGFYAPAVPSALSLYEASAFSVLGLLAVIAGFVLVDAVPGLPSLSGALRRLREAADEERSVVLDEVSSGRWPRVGDLVSRAKGFEGYRDMRDAAESPVVPGAVAESDGV